MGRYSVGSVGPRTYVGTELQKGWLGEIVPLDPLLVKPLDIHGNARRITYARALLEHLGFYDRVSGGEISAPTLCIAFTMLGPLADTVELGRINIEAHARRIAGCKQPYDRRNQVEPGDALHAMLDLGWGNTRIESGPLTAIRPAIQQQYQDLMAEHVTTLLRYWCDLGYLTDVSA